MPRQPGIYSLHSKALILLHNVGKIRAKNHEKKCREALFLSNQSLNYQRKKIYFQTFIDLYSSRND